MPFILTAKLHILCAVFFASEHFLKLDILQEMHQNVYFKTMEFS